MNSMIDVRTTAGETMPAYLALANGDGERAGVVLLQEIFGINGNMRAIADDYAARGFDAIVPDLFWRQEPNVQLDPANADDRDRATALMKGMDQGLAVQDALAAAAHLRDLGRASGMVAAVGYCLGGRLAFLLAMETGVDAAVSYYGVAIQSSLDKAPRLAAPLLLHIAATDHLCPPEAQQAIHGALADRPGVEIHDYPGVGHAFARRGGASFDAVAAERADVATAAFLAKTLAA